MDIGENIIITCFVCPAVYEILKTSIKHIYGWLQNGSQPYTMTGFWWAYHQAKDENVGKVFSAYEILDIRQQNSHLIITLYHHTNDGRFYTYKGKGYIRGNKVAISYEELGKSNSDNTGNITLRRDNTYQHRPRYTGIYSEFKRDNKNCTSREYTIEGCEISIWNKMLLKVFKSCYAKKYIRKCTNYQS